MKKRLLIIVILIVALSLLIPKSIGDVNATAHSKDLGDWEIVDQILTPKGSSLDLSNDGDVIYVAAKEGGVAKYEAATLALIQSKQLTLPTRGDIGQTVLSPDEQYLLLPDDGGALYFVDPSTLSVLHQKCVNAPCNSHIADVTSDSHWVVSSDSYAGQGERLRFYDIAVNPPTEAGVLYLSYGGWLPDVRVTPDNTEVYAVSYPGWKIHVVDIASRNLITTIPTSIQVNDLVMDPARDLAYASSYIDGGILVIDLSTRTIQDIWSVGQIYRMTYDPINDILVGAIPFQAVLKFISPATGEVIGSTPLPTDNWISSSAFSPDGNRLFVMTYNPDNILVNTLFVLEPKDKPPIVHAGGPYSGEEGNSIPLDSSTAQDDGNNLSYFWSVNSSLCILSDETILNPTLTCTDNGTFLVTLRVDDGVNPSVSSDATVLITNIAPNINTIMVPLDSININDQLVHFEVEFSDPGSADTHNVLWDWGDGSFCDTTYGDPACSVIDMNGLGTGDSTHTYTESDIYKVTVTVTDDDGDSANETYEFVIIYDPEGGFVTGGGWIDSPPGACHYSACTDDTTGKASFSFVSKYKRGAHFPIGNTEFQLKAGNLNFHSNNYQYLVVPGNKAIFKGVGTINGIGNYGFLISTIDGEVVSGTSRDLFRIKIWNDDTNGGIVYDNQVGCLDSSETANPCMKIDGGSIVIHKEK